LVWRPILAKVIRVPQKRGVEDVGPLGATLLGRDAPGAILLLLLLGRAAKVRGVDIGVAR
jgi:hypothetical protein